MFWIALLAILAAAIYWYLGKTLTYWRESGVQQSNVLNVLYINLKMMAGFMSFAEFTEANYKRFPTARYNGDYQLMTSMLLLRDPDLIKQMTVKDFDHFQDHRGAFQDDVEPLFSRNLVALKGEKWRHMRATLSPSFTSSKMKAMFVLMSECAETFVEYFAKKAAVSGGVVEVEMKDACTRYANDVIATSAFGIACDSLNEPENEFYVNGRAATNFKGFWKNMKFFVFIACPRLFKLFGITLFPKSVSEFFLRIVTETIRTREEKGIIRPDMIHLLMEARKGRLTYDEDARIQTETGFATVEESMKGTKNIRKEELTDLDVTAQALIFFFAGFDTVSTAMSFMAYELVVNPEVQERLREEIVTTLADFGGKVTYDALLKMKYMDMVLSETIRKWPPAVATDRLCVKPYTVEAAEEGEKPVYLKEGDVLNIPIYGIHRDETYYPNPEKFDPERFNEENRKTLNPYNYMPFGVGPRNCIGSRFALLETKAVFAHLLPKFELVATEKTQIPLKISKKIFNLAPEKDYWFGFKLREAVKA